MQNLLGEQLACLFDAIFIINLKSRPDRLSEITQQLSKIGLSIDHPKIHLFEAIRPEDKGDFPSLGARGCFFSHLGVLEKSRDAGHESVAILEDDADWSPSMMSAHPDELLALKNIDWGILIGGRPEKQARQSPITICSVPPNARVLGSHFCGFRRPVIGEMAQFLRTLASRPPGSPEGGPMHVDGAYGHYRKNFPATVTVEFTPGLAFQRASKTDIHPLPIWDRTVGVRDAVNLLRKLKRRF